MVKEKSITTTSNLLKENWGKKLQLVIWDNDITPFPVVVAVLKKFCNLSVEEATDIAQLAQKNGAAVCKEYMDESVAYTTHRLILAFLQEIDHSELKFELISSI